MSTGSAAARSALLLPGMDGTGALFAPFVAALAERHISADVVSYPRDVVLGYDALLEQVAARLLALSEPAIVVGESFSGPLAIRLAVAHPERVRALVLVASFATSPVRAPAFLVPTPMFLRPPPAFAVRMALLGPEATRVEVRALQGELATVRARVLAARLRAILRVDVRDALGRLTCPVLYLGGTRDRLVGARSRRMISASMPSARIELLDAPHLVVQRRPRESATLVDEWLRA